MWTLLAFLSLALHLSLRAQAACTRSHSQSGEEDAVIKHIFKEKRNGVYVEMGALDGVKFTNTLRLHTCFGWNGILIEGLKRNYKMLEENVKTTRPNVEIHHGAVCAPPSKHVDFQEGKFPEVSADLERTT
jgi:hypothetical protein